MNLTRKPSKPQPSRKPRKPERSTSTPQPEAVAKPEPTSTTDALFESLCETHGLTAAHHRALAWRIARALADGGAHNLAEACRAIPLLPTPRPTAAHRTVSEGTARERLMTLITNAIKAERIELAERVKRGEALSEVEQLRLQLIEAEAATEVDEEERVVAHGEGGTEVERLREENRELRRLLSGAQPAEGAPTVTETKVTTVTETKVIDPPTSAIVPPSEIGETYAGCDRKPAPDDWKVKPKPVLDLKAEADSPVKEPMKVPEHGKPAECPSWLKPVPQVAPENRINGGPPVARSGAETKAQMDRVNGDRSIVHRIMTEPGPAHEPQPSSSGTWHHPDWGPFTGNAFRREW